MKNDGFVYIMMKNSATKPALVHHSMVQLVSELRTRFPEAPAYKEFRASMKETNAASFKNGKDKYRVYKMQLGNMDVEL